MSGSIEILSAVLRIGGKYGEPYSWSCVLRYYSPTEVEIIGVHQLPSLEEAKLVKSFLESTGIKKVLIKRLRRGKLHSHWVILED
jgi:hypothetical protein